jgi:hypothetical protein
LHATSTYRKIEGSLHRDAWKVDLLLMDLLYEQVVKVFAARGAWLTAASLYLLALLHEHGVVTVRLLGTFDQTDIAIISQITTMVFCSIGRLERLTLFK